MSHQSSFPQVFPEPGQAALPARNLRTLRTVTALMLREMATSYGRSPGGYLWAILDPVAALALMSVIFAAAFSAPALGISFPLFYATGYLPFMMFNDVANKMATSILFSRPLMAYPAVTFVDALAARFLLNVLTHLMVAYLVFSGILLVFETRAALNLPAILLSLGMTAMLGIGIGTLNCYLMTAFPVWERAWQIATRPLFLISGVFFTYDGLPPMGQDILWYNPLIHVIGMMRHGFYPTYHAPYVSVGFVAAVAMLTGLAGLLLLWRHHRTLLEN
ncbi:MAG: ABC transporter permease [Paracoccaceae bacterium]|nr:ABC transporter permease [Paracoccaceae bacterium]